MTANRFHGASIALHWLMLVMLAAVYLLIELRGIYPRGSDPRELMKYGHFVLGLSVFVLIWIRLLIRLKTPTPAIVPAPPVWQKAAASLVKGFLYLFMVGMPLIGWAIVSAEGHTISVFGLNLPSILDTDKDLAHDLEEIHEFIGQAGYWAIGLHTLAALYHHYVRKDNTLRRMTTG